MFKRFCKRMKNPRYRVWLLGHTAIIFCLLLIMATVAVLVFAPIASKSDMGDMPEETTAAATCPAETETAVTEPPTAPQHTETVVTETYTYFDCELSEDLQKFIFDLCEEKQIDPAIIVAMCRKESTCNPSVIGDGGDSFGLMQVQPRWHYGRMVKLGCTDLLDPCQNITVGVDYLCELLNRYGSIEAALTAYNSGIYNGTVTNYATDVLEKAASLGVKQ